MLALVVTVARAEVEVASDVLWSLGAAAVEERGDRDEIELWTALGDDRASVEHAVGPAFAGRRVSWRFETVDESVADTWRSFATATWVDDDLVVVPAWQPVPQLADGVVAVHIDPGVTFGAGDHPTTVLSLRAMRRVLHPGATVLDVGCGSGVLAVAAAMLGARIATGVDISPAAVPSTLENALRNGVGDRVVASTAPLDDVDEAVDLVVANILAPTLIELSSHLLRLVAPDGALVISGVLAGRFDHVVRALAPLRVERVDQLDGWAAVTLRR
ncbi:MAG: 50S ribosomal protein L11 methyltransferase [Ilumatobacteraceae bacterium]